MGAVASGLLIASLLFLPWYTLSHSNAARDPSSQSYSADAFICGKNDFSCTGFETFPIMRWVLLAGALAPLILAWILVRGHKLSWAPGELTMIVGFTAAVLIFYNGIVDRPGSGIAESGVGLDYGYFVAMVGAIGIAATGFFRSMESGAAKGRKAPGTV